MRSCCLAGPLTVRRSPWRTQPLTHGRSPRGEGGAPQRAEGAPQDAREEARREGNCAHRAFLLTLSPQTGVAPPAAAEAEAAPEAAKQAMEVSSEPSVASPAKGAGGDVEMGSDHDSDFAPPKLTKRPSRRGQ